MFVSSDAQDAKRPPYVPTQREGTSENQFASAVCTATGALIFPTTVGSRRAVVNKQAGDFKNGQSESDGCRESNRSTEAQRRRAR